MVLIHKELFIRENTLNVCLCIRYFVEQTLMVAIYYFIKLSLLIMLAKYLNVYFMYFMSLIFILVLDISYFTLQLYEVNLMCPMFKEFQVLFSFFLAWIPLCGVNLMDI